MQNTTAQLTDFLTRPDVAPQIAKGIITLVDNCTPSEIDRLTPSLGYLFETAHLVKNYLPIQL